MSIAQESPMAAHLLIGFQRLASQIVGRKVGKAKERVLDDFGVGVGQQIFVSNAAVHLEVGGPESADVDVPFAAGDVDATRAHLQNVRKSEEFLFFRGKNGIMALAPLCKAKVSRGRKALGLERLTHLPKFFSLPVEERGKFDFVRLLV